MKHRVSLLTSALFAGFCLTLAPLAMAADHTDAPILGNDSIRNADFGGIHDWRAYDSKYIYVQALRDKAWYRGEFFAPCFGLQAADTVAFDLEPSGEFDKFSAVIVRDRRCQLRSLIKIDGAPSKAGRGTPQGNPVTD